MSVLEIGQKMVAMVSQGREGEEAFISEYYAPDVVSIEGQGTDEMPARLQGLEAIRGKHEWWYANHEIHEINVDGPYLGHREDQFALRFTMAMTPKGGERMEMAEMALFTVRDGKVVQEEFLYLMS
ncbi:MAG: nuclear transport factor 2 family protein [Pseudomonadota bacterium]